MTDPKFDGEALNVTVYVLVSKLAVIVLLPVTVPDALSQYAKEWPDDALAVTVVPLIVTLFPDVLIVAP